VDTLTRTRSNLPPAAAFAAIPAVVGTALAWHPPDPAAAWELDGLVPRWLTVHLVLLVGMPLLALLVQWMLRGVPGRLATFARSAVVPAAVLYAAFEALVGIGTGVLVERTASLPAAHQPGAAALAQAWWEVPAVVAVIAGVAVSMWTIAVASAAVAVHRAGASRLAAWALATSAMLFAAGHPGATGAASMAAMAVAVVATARVVTDRRPDPVAAGRSHAPER
jgi:hypothetical protein